MAGHRADIEETGKSKQSELKVGNDDIENEKNDNDGEWHHCWGVPSPGHGRRLTSKNNLGTVCQNIGDLWAEGEGSQGFYWDYSVEVRKDKFRHRALELRRNLEIEGYTNDIS